MQDEIRNEIKASNTIDSGHAQHFDIEFPKDGTEPVITSNIPPEILEEPTVDQQPVYEAIGGQTMSRSDFNEKFGIPTAEPQCDFQPLPDPEVNALLDLLAADYNERLTIGNIEADAETVSDALKSFAAQDVVDTGTQANVAPTSTQVTEFRTSHFVFKNPA